MLCPQYNCLFVHVPKTAGQSVENYFLSKLDMSWAERSELLLKPNSDRTLGPERLAHLYAHEYIDMGYVSRQTFQELYKFTFVRNPFDRLVSEYKYRKLDVRHSFKDFVLNRLPSDEFLNDTRHIVPQSRYLFDENEALLVDFVGRFENLNQDFATICEALNFDDRVLPYVNKTKRSYSVKDKVKRFLVSGGEKNSYRDYYDQSLVKTVSRIYEEDLNNFNYDF
jgi:hypothetical protein